MFKQKLQVSRFNDPFKDRMVPSSSLRAASQVRPTKQTLPSVLSGTSNLSIFKSSGLTSSSYIRNMNVAPGKPKGLPNLRNTCYINSILQLLFDLLDLPITVYSKPISKAYMALRDSYDLDDYKNFKKEVERKLEFVKGDDQQDAQQFLRGLLEAINQENRDETSKKPILFEINYKVPARDNWQAFIKEMKNIDNSMVIDLFAGETHIELKCPYGHIKYTFERYMDLNLAFPKDNTTDLRGFFRNYFKEEYIEGVECESCKKKTRFFRKVSIYNLPKILVLHLNRFQQGYFSNSKIKTQVSYDQSLTIPNEVLHTDIRHNQYKYRLQGAVCHIGSMNSGHYYAIKKGKGSYSNSWFVCNDEIIKDSVLKAYSNLSQSVYILFYRMI